MSDSGLIHFSLSSSIPVHLSPRQYLWDSLGLHPYLINLPVQYVSKKLMRVLTCLQNHFHLCYKWSTGRHKYSSERSISEAAQCFGNLCVYKPSALRKKPSDACLEKCVEGQRLFLSHTIRSVGSSVIVSALTNNVLTVTINLRLHSNVIKLRTASKNSQKVV